MKVLLTATLQSHIYIVEIDNIDELKKIDSSYDDINDKMNKS